MMGTPKKPFGFKEKISLAQDLILDLSNSPKEAVAIAFVITVNILHYQLKTDTVDVQIGEDTFEVKITKVGK